MQTTDAAHVASHGRMRQRIVALGGVRSGARDPARFTRDRYLRALVRSGQITSQHLRRAVRAYERMTPSFLWMSNVHQAVLERADCVFLAEYRRFPTEDADFQLNGTYHRICRGLEYDWHYYDDQLENLQHDESGNPRIRSDESVRVQQKHRNVEVKRGNVWAFGLVLVAGLAGGPILGVEIARSVSDNVGPTMSVFAILWILSFAGLLALMLPRRTWRRDIFFTCGRCGGELGFGRNWTGCPTCGVLFAS